MNTVITGASGQDGIFLTDKILRDTKSNVYLCTRSKKDFNFNKLNSINKNVDLSRIKVIELDYLNFESVSNFIDDIHPDYFFNLMGPSSVKSFIENPSEMTEITNIGFENILDIKFIVPKAGDNRKILDLSLRNATQFKIEKLKQVQIVDPERHSLRILDQMKTDLRLNKNPVHIECFDNSNIQRSNPVASCVVFKNAKPSKKDYRLFNIKTVLGPDDYASMEEVVYRRYKRMTEEGDNLPNLIGILSLE